MITALITKTRSLLCSNNTAHMRARYVKAGGTVFVGFLIANIVNYIFTLAMGRMLLPESFGVVTALLGLLAIVSVPANAVVTFIAQKVSYHQARKQYEIIRILLSTLGYYTKISAVLFWVVFIVLIPFIADYLGGVSYVVLGVFSFLIPVVLFSALRIGVLQGYKDFYSFVVQNIIGTVIKFALAVVFVWLGWSVLGVMTAVLTSMIVAYYYAYIRARVHTEDSGTTVVSEEGVMSRKKIIHGIVFIFITTALLTVIANIDVVLARNLLDPYLAGQYGALSTTGKILLYGLGAFITVLVPLASSVYSGEGRQQNVFLGLACCVITLVSVGVIAIFQLFSEQVVQILFGQQYMSIHTHLGMFGVAMYFVAIIILLSHYFIAIQKTQFVYVLFLGTVLQVVLFYMSRQSLAGMVHAFVVSSGILAGAMIVYYGVLGCAQKSLFYIKRSLKLDRQFLRIPISLRTKVYFLVKKYFIFLYNKVFGFRPGVSSVSVFGRRYYYQDVFGLAFLQSVYVDHVELLKCIDQGGVIIDVGANIGQFNFFCQQYLKAKTVYSFEPVAQSFQLLQKNTDSIVFHNAVTPHDYVKMYIPECTSLMASVFSIDDNDRLEVVPGVRIDDIAAIQNESIIDLLKIDTEGSEFSVLMTAQETLKKTRFILAELSVGRDSDASFLDVIRFLHDMTPSFRVRSIGRIYSDHTGDLALDVLFENTREHLV